MVKNKANHSDPIIAWNIEPVNAELSSILNGAPSLIGIRRHSDWKNAKIVVWIPGHQEISLQTIHYLGDNVSLERLEGTSKFVLSEIMYHKRISYDFENIDMQSVAVVPLLESCNRLLIATDLLWNNHYYELRWYKEGEDDFITKYESVDSIINEYELPYSKKEYWKKIFDRYRSFFDNIAKKWIKITSTKNLNCFDITKCTRNALDKDWHPIIIGYWSSN